MKRMEMGKNTGLLHGGDYNPDQWLDCPEILAEDIQLMKKANVNCVSLGIFAWSRLEPQEGRYELDWLVEIIRNLYENGIYTILATPTGAMPHWLTQRYEEVRQVREDGMRNDAGKRHNYCPSSPVMREKAGQIDRKLAERLGGHPGVIGWHISNEIANHGIDGACHCDYCQSAFRAWLQEKYGSLECLNKAWWTAFWSHTYTDWSQIRSPSARGENLLHGLNLDWKRFVSDRQLDFCREEIRAVRSFSSLPVTTNMMGFFRPLDYFRWAGAFDIISWDCYPDWHGGADELQTASDTAAAHSLMRGLKKASFLMMESTPSVVNWRDKNRLKRPGMHELSSLQAVACGSDSVQYFQWRKSRGSCEKYHGAVVDHKNGEDTRVFRDVKRLGERLRTISAKTVGTCNQARIAMIFDWENWWAVEDANAVDNSLRYQRIFLEYFRPFWELGLEVDVIDMDSDMDTYSMVVAPLNYLYREGYADRVRGFVKRGGCYVTTCWSGEVNDTDLVYLEKHPLEDVLGIVQEEIDVPGGYCENYIRYQGQSFRIEGMCALVHGKGAEVLAEYQNDFYAGYPALTRNHYGEGDAYYIASMNEMDFLRTLYKELTQERQLCCGLQAEFPRGVTVNERRAPGRRLWFLQNFNREKADVKLLEQYINIETGEVMEGRIAMEPFACLVLEDFQARRST